MSILFVTKASGGHGRPASMTVIPPSQEVSPAALAACGAAAGLNGVALADVVSAIAMHARVSARLARAAAEQTSQPARRQLHEHLAQMYEDRVTTLEGLLHKLGLPRRYVSPAARMAAFVAESVGQAPLLSGSIDAGLLEFVLLDVASTLAERSLADTRALAAIAGSAQPSSVAVQLAKASHALKTDVALLEKVQARRSQELLAVVQGPKG
ncbi:hypothetical protein [Nannocystis bainbridge]|uniref:Uncharacterized protein n=1 Tax=Nannocystis bainbridge TaxID=2995303 RepID=A0ABT5DQ50_9BACT|nr:hypothetical protein [Nannocystis bainbridge]MDC0715671.1 hypothetical protein [Nannocystis bainbridge]